MSNNGEQPDPPKPKINFNPDDLCYDMSGEKHLVIFNHFKYKSTVYYNFKPPLTRTGTNEDVKKLKSVFGKLGFKVVVHHDLDHSGITDVLTEMRDTDYSHVSCLCIVVLTHGRENDGLCAADRAYNLKDITKRFESHPTLAGKPKLFFIQACRGREMDDGNRVAIDGEGDKKTMVIPSHADFLVMRSTVEDYKSYRDDRGSWMMQELCAIITEADSQQLLQELDILRIITLTNKRIALVYSTNTPGKQKTQGKKQIPETVFTLTKLLMFKQAE